MVWWKTALINVRQTLSLTDVTGGSLRNQPGRIFGKNLWEFLRKLLVKLVEKFRGKRHGENFWAFLYNIVTSKERTGVCLGKTYWRHFKFDFLPYEFLGNSFKKKWCKIIAFSYDVSDRILLKAMELFLNEIWKEIATQLNWKKKSGYYK